MKKLIVTLILVLGSTNLFADIQCGKGSWVFPPKFEGKILKVEIKGTCTLTTEGDLEKLKEFYIASMTDAPEVREVHNVNDKDTFSEIPATEIDSTIFNSTDNGDLEIRFLTHVGINQDRLLFNKESKEILRATGNSKYLRKITEVLNISKTSEGFKVEITSGTHLKMPKFFKKMALKEIKKTFPSMLKEITSEIADNL
ncbi:MAG: hypothetical protein DRQ88_00230 [Epsilonproteobacteria bacterium]|nr:MAG: hypothetical protein DRQ89_06155 [Campylobacterota bacterium]RLA68063.1 MAG: hypothetical protein DRQ88_00230 [Campylobacterota bacterium]